jgi:hypothetical protein
MAACCGGGVGARLNCCSAAVAAVTARIVVVGIVADYPNSVAVAVVVDAADP